MKTTTDHIREHLLTGEIVHPLPTCPVCGYPIQEGCVGWDEYIKNKEHYDTVNNID